MNEKTKQRLESEINVPAPTQPVDKLRIGQSPAAASPGTHPSVGDPCPGGQGCAATGWSIGCYADDE